MSLASLVITGRSNEQRGGNNKLHICGQLEILYVTETDALIHSYVALTNKWL